MTDAIKTAAVVGAIDLICDAIKERSWEPCRSDAENIYNAFDELSKEITAFVAARVERLRVAGLCGGKSIGEFETRLVDAFGEIQSDVINTVEARLEEFAR
jgi:hypothetical protein